MNMSEHKADERRRRHGGDTHCGGYESWFCEQEDFKDEIADLRSRLEVAEERIGLARVALEPRSFVYCSPEHRAEVFRLRAIEARAILTQPANAGGIASEGGHSVQRDVEELYRALGHPVGTDLAISSPTLTADLIEEEAGEAVEAIRREDLVEAIDGICDLICTAYGAAVQFGVNLAPFWDEVHRTNLAKVGGPVREDGKRLKPEGWQPPDIAGILAQQSSAEGIASEGGSAQAANPRELRADAPSAEADVEADVSRCRDCGASMADRLDFHVGTSSWNATMDPTGSIREEIGDPMQREGVPGIVCLACFDRRAESARVGYPVHLRPQDAELVALAGDLAGALEAVDDGGDNEWLGDDEATDFSLSGADRRCINAALARYHEAIGPPTEGERDE